MTRQIITFRALRGDDRFLAAEAAVLVVLLRVGLRLLSFVSVRRLVDRYSSWHQAPAGLWAHETIGRIAAAVTAVARRLPSGTTCLVEALAVEAMLRRRGFEPTLQFGTRRPGSGATLLEAHAWVECAGSVVVGGLADLADYAVLSPSRNE
jgi:hypothetical protein